MKAAQDGQLGAAPVLDAERRVTCFGADDGKDWLLCASHEASLTAAGKELVDVVIALWPAYREHPWSWG